MKRIKSELDLDRIQSECARMFFMMDGSGAEMLTIQGQGLEIVSGYKGIILALAEIKRLREIDPLHVMVNKLGPGVRVPEHRDFLPPAGKQIHMRYPVVERWHLPIVTNMYAAYWDELNQDTFHMERGFWYGPIPYYKKHRVWNDGNEERIHLVVDLDNPTCVGEYDEDFR